METNFCAQYDLKQLVGSRINSLKMERKIVIFCFGGAKQNFIIFSLTNYVSLNQGYHWCEKDNPEYKLHLIVVICDGVR